MYTVKFNTPREAAEYLHELGEEATDENYHDFAEFYYAAAHELRDMEPPFRLLVPADHYSVGLTIIEVG